MDTNDLFSKVLARDTRALARAATLIENRTDQGRELVRQIFPNTGRAVVVGITGPAGAGKSTLVDQLIMLSRHASKRVAVIAIDPSSPYSRGAILGDRIRMGAHHNDPGVFIRSAATRGHIGGVTQSTWELALLLDAANYDLVLIETVGVGQDEVDIARLADITVVVLVPGLGDDVQVVKAGIMEIADIFAINKADQPGAERLEAEIRFMQSLAGSPGVKAPVVRVTATTGEGVDALLSCIHSSSSKHRSTERQIQLWSMRLKDMLRDSLMSALPEEILARHAELLVQRAEDPQTALEALRTQVISPI